MFFGGAAHHLLGPPSLQTARPVPPPGSVGVRGEEAELWTWWRPGDLSHRVPVSPASGFKKNNVVEVVFSGFLRLSSSFALLPQTILQEPYARASSCSLTFAYARPDAPQSILSDILAKICWCFLPQSEAIS